MTPTELKAWYDDKLVVGCECWSPEEAVRLIRETLEYLAAGGSFYRHALLMNAGPDIAALFEFFLKRLDHAGVIEHGSTIAGAWLTPLGREVLAAITELGDDPDVWEELAEDAAGYI